MIEFFEQVSMKLYVVSEKETADLVNNNIPRSILDMEDVLKW
jgi:hypothetical protein